MATNPEVIEFQVQPVVLTVGYWRAAEAAARRGADLTEIGTVGLIPGLIALWLANDVLRVSDDDDLLQAVRAAVVAIVKQHPVHCADHLWAQRHNNWSPLRSIPEVENCPAIRAVFTGERALAGNSSY